MSSVRQQTSDALSENFPSNYLGTRLSNGSHERKLFLKKEKNLVKTVENENNVLVRETNEDFPAEDFQFRPFFSKIPFVTLCL